MAIVGFADQLFIVGLLVQIPVGEASVTVDKSFSCGTKISGAILLLSDCRYGDYGDFVLVHPQAGVVGAFAEACYLPEGAREINIDLPDGSTEVLPGLIYRFTLTAIDTNGRKAIVWLLVRR